MSIPNGSILPSELYSLRPTQSFIPRRMAASRAADPRTYASYWAGGQYPEVPSFTASMPMTW